MKTMSTEQLRTVFLQYFQANDHVIQPSSTLVPGDDPTLLFTNAGMVPFKDVFLGRENIGFKRATSSQRCVRAGGKHNDLENVGYTARHHTFFEMLGNFSFGDYFKKEAIHFAWNFLTNKLEIPSEKLWVTVFDEDTEAENIWLNEIGIDPGRFSRIGAKDNFWSMGEIGPCGPCSEIFYDHGEDVQGGPPGSPDEEGDRYIEIWNLVFMQYNRSADGTLTELPSPSVDTGMGLERIAAVLQGVHNNYEIDLFQNLLTAAAKVTGFSDTSHSSLRVIVDHIRSCAFLIVDGVMPSNEGRGYVLRRIIRRAIRHGYRLGVQDLFFYQLVPSLVEQMGSVYPELTANQEQVERVLEKEEQRFSETLQKGMTVLEACVGKLDGLVIPGSIVFLLYDTYGFPVDLTADFARENNLKIDQEGFEKEMESQRERARAASNFGADHDKNIAITVETEFVGYQQLKGQAVLLGLFSEGNAVERLSEGEEGVLVLDSTPFYAESGGQIGDVGMITFEGNQFEVFDTQKQSSNTFLHKGKVISGALVQGQSYEASVDCAARQLIILNHSATHLLHAALREVLGEHVIQKGSLVNSSRLRFDFSHFEPIGLEELAQIEQLVNLQIRKNGAVSADLMTKDEAVKAGAMALFGEKYGAEVRVLKIGDFSIELCGGTHVDRAGDIGCFKIVSETGVAAGVRRIEAVTGEAALNWSEVRNKALGGIAEVVKSTPEQALAKVSQLIEKNKQLEKELEKLKLKLVQSSQSELSTQAVKIEGINVLAVQLDDVDGKGMRDVLDQLKNKLGSAAIILAVVNGGKVSLIAGVSKDQTGRVKAGDLVNFVAAQVGGKGGGRPEMAQAGGNDPAGLEKALADVPEWIRSQISS
ncbi:MAG: alanine--tRNA ligase [Methylococcaceae bacterium]|nr:alanine--tRNA ligase [Methylococcaceae bacterium]